MKKDLPTMVEIDGKVISLDVITEKFSCDLARCRGACCVHGESGAPLDDDEVTSLMKEFRAIRKVLRPEGIDAILQQGTSVLDADQEMVTPLVDGKECAYAIFEDGIARCGIELAFEMGLSKFRKPVSCHLYPVRVKRYHQLTAVNYDQWGICEPARIHGEKQDMQVFRFVREGIERKFGIEFYKKLEILSVQVG